MQVDQEDDSVVDSTLSELILLFVFTCIMAGAVAASQLTALANRITPFPEITNLSFVSGQHELTKDIRASIATDIIPVLQEIYDDPDRDPQKYRIVIIGHTDEVDVRPREQRPQPDAMELCSRPKLQEIAFDTDDCHSGSTQYGSNLALATRRAVAARAEIYRQAIFWEGPISVVSAGKWHDTKGYFKGDAPEGIPEILEEAKTEPLVGPGTVNTETEGAYPKDNEFPAVRRIEILLIRV